MKTLFVCASGAIERHVGEEYDDIVEVSDEPTTADIDRWAGIISGRVRRLWAEDASSADHAVQIHLDGPGPYNVVLQNLRIILGQQDSMALRLAYLPENDERTCDAETSKVLARLGGRHQSKE